MAAKHNVTTVDSVATSATMKISRYWLFHNSEIMV